jgi:hypothetical protein
VLAVDAAPVDAAARRQGFRPGRIAVVAVEKPPRYATLARTLIRGGADMRQMVIAAALALVIGCGGDHADTRPRLPQMTDVGGPKLANPQVVPIFFSDDLEAEGLAMYTQMLIGSQWLVAVGGEYGVGASAYVGAVHRTDPAPAAIDDREVVDLLFKGLADAELLSDLSRGWRVQSR